MNGAIRKAIRSQPTGNSALNEPARYSVPPEKLCKKREQKEQIHGDGSSATKKKRRRSFCFVPSVHVIVDQSWNLTEPRLGLWDQSRRKVKDDTKQNILSIHWGGVCVCARANFYPLVLIHSTNWPHSMPSRPPTVYRGATHQLRRCRGLKSLTPRKSHLPLQTPLYPG